MRVFVAEYVFVCARVCVRVLVCVRFMCFCIASVC